MSRRSLAGIAPDASQAVAAAVADARGVEPADRDFPLSEQISPSGIEMLLAHESGPWELSFGVPGHMVKVLNTGAAYVDGERYEETITVTA